MEVHDTLTAAALMWRNPLPAHQAPAVIRVYLNWLRRMDAGGMDGLRVLRGISSCHVGDLLPAALSSSCQRDRPVTPDITDPSRLRRPLLNSSIPLHGFFKAVNNTLHGGSSELTWDSRVEVARGSDQTACLLPAANPSNSYSTCQCSQPAAVVSSLLFSRFPRQLLAIVHSESLTPGINFELRVPEPFFSFSRTQHRTTASRSRAPPTSQEHSIRYTRFA